MLYPALLVPVLLGSKIPAPQPRPGTASIRRFDENAGQWPDDVRYLARTPHGTLVLGPAGARFQLRSANGESTAEVGLTWDAGARRVAGIDRLPGVSNYLVGSDRRAWRTGIAGFGRVRYTDVAPRVDLEFYGARDGFEYDVVVKPGGKPGAFSLRLDGVSAAHVAEDGSIVLETIAGTFRQRAPIAFQERGGVRTPVDVRYALDGGRMRLVAGQYDRSRPLVIDPTIDFSTYVSGVEYTDAVATDASGNIYVTGSTRATTVLSVPTAVGSYDDVFVAKFTPSGSLVYVTFLGGEGPDVAASIAVTASGAAVIGGLTGSLAFPTTSAFQSTNRAFLVTGFVAKLSEGGSLVFSTFLGGSLEDRVQGVAVDPAGGVYAAGTTRSADFPLRNAFRTTPGGSFVAKFTSQGALVYSTYFGDGAPTLEDLDWSSEFRVNLFSIAADANGAAYVAGSALSSSLPTTPGAYRETAGDGQCTNPFGDASPCLDGVVAKLTPLGTLAYATYVRGDNERTGGLLGNDSIGGIAVDRDGNAVVVGTTDSDTFPTTPGAVRSSCTAPCSASRIFVTKLNAAGSGLVFSGLLGSPGGGDAVLGGLSPRRPYLVGSGGATIAIDALGRTVVSGSTTATDLPMVDAQQTRMNSGSLVRLTSNASVVTPLSGPPGKDVVSMAVAPDGTQYAAAKNDGAPSGPWLFKSIDHGGTWTQLSGAADASAVSVDPGNSAAVYTPADKSADGGITWTPLGLTLAAPPLVRPGAPQVLFGFVRSGPIGPIVKSVDGGTTWAASSAGITNAVYDIAMAPSNPDVMYAWGTTLFVSADGGASWAEAAPPYFDWRFIAVSQVAIDPARPGTVYASVYEPFSDTPRFAAAPALAAASGYGVWKSADFGRSWTKSLGTSTWAIAAPSPDVVVLSADPMRISTNGGASWTSTLDIVPRRLVPDRSAPGALFGIMEPWPDVFVAALSSSGALVYESYLGGTSGDWAYGIATTPDRGIVVAGWTFSEDFPTVNAIEPTGKWGGFLTKLRFPEPIVSVDTPSDHVTIRQPFTLGGWAIDPVSATDDGIDGVHVWAYSSAGIPTFIGAPRPDVARPDVAAAHGSQFANAGFNVTVNGLAPGTYTFALAPHSTVTNGFSAPRVMTITVLPSGLATIDAPASGGTTYGGGTLGGWAIDRAATTGTGVSTVHVWAYPNPGSGQAPIFLGVAGYGVARSDIGAIYGSQFTNSGFNLTLPPLAPGPYLFVASPFSSVTNAFAAPATVFAMAGAAQPFGSVDVPAPSAPVSGSFTVAGWAIDRAAPAGTGVSAVHVYAFAAGSGTPIFLGVATLGLARPDVGANFGARFTPSGYSLTTSLPPGTYDVYTYARSTVSGDTAVRGVHIVVQ